MANTLRIKRRAAGGAAGAPNTLVNAELAFNEQDDTLYYGKGTGGLDGSATNVIAIAGPGSFTTLTTEQTISGNKSFTGTVVVPTPTSNAHAATKLYVDGLVSNVATAFSVAGDSGSLQTITTGLDTLTIAGGIGINTVTSSDTVTVRLSNTGVSASSYGSANSVASFTVDAQGRLTSASSSTINITASQVSDFDEAAQDAVGSIISNGNVITKTYDDVNGIIKFDLNNTSVTSGTYGNASHIPTFSVDSQGRLTSAGTNAVLIDLGTNTNGNYVASVAAGTGISVSNTGVEGGTFTVTNEGVLSATGTGNQIAVSAANGNVTFSLANDVTIPNNLTVTGDLLVQGNTTTLNTSTLAVEDKNIILSNTASPSDSSADGAGITVKGSSDKTFNWVDSTDAWTSSEHLDLASGKAYMVNGSIVLSNTTLGSGVVHSSLTSVGTITSGTWNGSTLSISYGGTGATTAPQARTNLGLAIGVDVQAYDAELNALAGLASAADKLPYFTGSGTASLTDLTSYARTLISAANAATARTTLELGTIALQNASSVSITGGTLSAVTISNSVIDGGTF